MRYVHLGSNKSVPSDYIVGIFDLDGEITTPITAEFLSMAEKDGIIETVGGDIPKSFVVCQNKSGEEVFLTCLSSSTVEGRAEQ